MEGCIQPNREVPEGNLLQSDPKHRANTMASGQVSDYPSVALNESLNTLINHFNFIFLINLQKCQNMFSLFHYGLLSVY